MGNSLGEQFWGNRPGVTALGEHSGNIVQLWHGLGFRLWLAFHVPFMLPRRDLSCLNLNWPFLLTTYLESCSWNEAAVALLTQQLRSSVSVAASLAAQQLPEFGVNVSSIRSVLVSSTTIDPIATANGTAYLVNIQMTVVLVGLHSDDSPSSKHAQILMDEFSPSDFSRGVTLICSQMLPPGLELLLQRRGGQSAQDAGPRLHNRVLQPAGCHLQLRHHHGRDHYHGEHHRCCCHCCIGHYCNAGALSSSACIACVLFTRI